MRLRLLQAVTVASVLAVVVACGRSTPADSSPAIGLTVPEDGSNAYLEVTGLSDDLLDAIEGAGLSDEQWPAVFRVSVDANAPAVLGTYAIAGGALRFTPLFQLDEGRQYEARFDPSTVPGATADAEPPLVTVVGRPASDAVPSTVVARVYPTGDIIPENLLRMYIEFSGPMGRRSGIEYLTLLDESDREIEGAFLPLDYEFWSPDHTRFTVFFDPGRVKQDILPNREMGRALVVGESVTLAISPDWRDENGLPLKEEYRRTFVVGPADEQPLDTATWTIDPPAAAGREPLVVTFPKSLDHGLLMRTIGVRRDGDPIEGDIVVDEAETVWTFTPRSAWRVGTYDLLAFDTLEDLAGNQIGRAFEVDVFETVDRSPNPQTITIPFVVR